MNDAGAGGPTRKRADEDTVRRRRREQVFGEVLPESTSDDRDPDAGPGEVNGRGHDDWLRSNVPPHHG